MTYTRVPRENYRPVVSYWHTITYTRVPRENYRPVVSHRQTITYTRVPRENYRPVVGHWQTITYTRVPRENYRPVVSNWQAITYTRVPREIYRPVVSYWHTITYTSVPRENCRSVVSYWETITYTGVPRDNYRPVVSYWETITYTRVPETELCSYCLETKESLIHLFYECRFVRSLWLQFTDNMRCDINININPVECIPGVLFDPNCEILNTCLIIIRYYIYVCRIKREMINWKGCLKTLIYYRNIDLKSVYICTPRQAQIITRKWELKKNLFQSDE